MPSPRTDDPPVGFRSDYADPPRPGLLRAGSLGSADERATRWALQEGSRRITRINETTRDGVRRRIREAIDQGMSPREAGEYVREWSGFGEYRAERIARTEMMFAYNGAALRTYGDYGLTEVVADDGDKDEECAARHGKVFTVYDAQGIQDHPNGTLDWLPVAPTMTSRGLQERLNERRPIRGMEQPGIVEPPRPPKPPRPPRPPKPEPPKPQLQVRPRSAQAEQRIADYQQEASRRALGQRDSGGFFRQEGATIHNTSADFARVGIDPARGRIEPARWLHDENTLVLLDSLEGGTAQRLLLDLDDVVAAIDKGADIRYFTADGKWLEFRPFQGAAPITGEEHAAFIARRMANPGRPWNDEMRDLLAGRGQITEGSFTPNYYAEKQAADRLAAEVARQEAEAEAKRLAALQGSPLSRMPRADIRRGIADGTIKLEDVAEQRWGWKGGSRFDPNKGFVIRPTARARNSVWTREHEAQFFDAFEDVAAKAGGYGRMKVDQVRFMTRDSTTAAADYGSQGLHTGKYGEGLVKTSRVQFYQNSGRELGKHGRAYGIDDMDDFYSVAVHELGHALDYGSASHLQGLFDQLQRAAKRRGQGPVVQLERQLKSAQERIRWDEQAIDRAIRERETGFYPGRKWVDPKTQTIRPDSFYTEAAWRDYQDMILAQRREALRVAHEHVETLKRQVEEARAAFQGTGDDFLMTEYSGKSGREAFAEAIVFYVRNPDELRKRAPGMFKFIEDVIKGSETYR